jgi:SAM-dependent methyltransferase
MMIRYQKFKYVIKKAIPETAYLSLINTNSQLRTLHARRVFKNSEKEPCWLESDMLNILQKKYPFPSEYGYDPASCERRGSERADEILNLKLEEPELIRTFLELGCWDGMVSCMLHRMGKITTAIDAKVDGFDVRAHREGVKLKQMNASNLQIEDESFDFIFSYDAFEHFQDPEKVLKEAIRVVRTGGYIYLVFGPLYMAPKGLHAYRSITVPYCQFLFPRDILEGYVRENSLTPIDFDQINCWSLERYRNLWNKYSHRLQRIRYIDAKDQIY